MVVTSHNKKCRGRLFAHCTSETQVLSFCSIILHELAFILIFVASWSQEECHRSRHQYYIRGRKKEEMLHQGAPLI